MTEPRIAGRVSFPLAEDISNEKSNHVSHCIELRIWNPAVDDVCFTGQCVLVERPARRTLGSRRFTAINIGPSDFDPGVRFVSAAANAIHLSIRIKERLAIFRYCEARRQSWAFYAVERNEVRDAVLGGGMDRKILRWFTLSCDLGANAGVTRAECVIWEAGPIAADGAFERSQSRAVRIVEGIVDAFDPLYVWSEADIPFEIECQVRAEAAVDRDRVNQMPECRFAAISEIVTSGKLERGRNIRRFPR